MKIRESIRIRISFLDGQTVESMEVGNATDLGFESIHAAIKELNEWREMMLNDQEVCGRPIIGASITMGVLRAEEETESD